MKKVTVLLFLLAALPAMYAQVSARYMVEQLLLPSQGKVFRGFDFLSMEEDIQPTEEARYKVSEAYVDYDSVYNMYIGYDIDFDDNNYIELDYFLDLEGMAEVYANIYPDSDQKAADIFNELNSYYSGKCGRGGIQSDGWTKFDCSYEGDEYAIWIYLDEDEYGKFVKFELILNY